MRVIGITENQAPTRSLTRVVPVENGVLQSDFRQDIAHLALIERHHATGQVVNGFVSGFGFKVPCGLASTVAHDSHNMIVVGTSRKNMAAAANRLNQIGGGIVVYKEGEDKPRIVGHNVTVCLDMDKFEKMEFPDWFRQLLEEQLREK